MSITETWLNMSRDGYIYQLEQAPSTDGQGERNYMQLDLSVIDRGDDCC